MTKLALIMSALCLTAVPALAGASQGGVSRLYQSQCYPGVGCWPLGYEPMTWGYDPAWHGFPAPFYHNRTCPTLGGLPQLVAGGGVLAAEMSIQPVRHKACEH
jgi:hypothetical protein